jgi:hypothetical protein
MMETVVLSLSGARGAQGDKLNVLAAGELVSGRIGPEWTHLLLTDYGKNFGTPNRLSELKPGHAPEHGCLVFLSTTEKSVMICDFCNTHDREAFLTANVGEEFSLAGKAGRRWIGRKIELNDIPVQIYGTGYAGHMVDNGQEAR